MSIFGSIMAKLTGYAEAAAHVAGSAAAAVGAAVGIGSAHAGLDAVIGDAGAALREAKIAGRNCVRAAPIPPRQNHTPARSAG